MGLSPEQDVEAQAGGTAVCLNAQWNEAREQSWVMPKGLDNGRDKVTEQARGDGIQCTGVSRPQVGARTSHSSYRRRESTWYRCRWDHRSGGRSPLEFSFNWLHLLCEVSSKAMSSG